MLEKIRQQIAAEMSFLQTNQREATVRMTIVRGCSEILHNHGSAFGWKYSEVEDLRLSLTQGLIKLLQTNDLLLASSDLDRFARKYEQLMKREYGPFAGCTHCRAKCIYRLEARDLLSPTDRRWINSDLKDSSYKTRTDRYTAIAKLAKGMAERWLGASNFVAPDIGYCGALHAAAALDLTEYEQALFGDYLSPELLK
jgi:hypothetical protein